ncbi:MAG TPA: crotonase/enoyl-CoA hydratase family protein [Acetobacteraceae bacterium]|nr:crotonase/enoyl-CoA hydratase family protein [Acetobacteraceae bacterium]
MFPDLPASLVATREGEVAVLRLARPEKRNALDDATVAGIGHFFEALPDWTAAVVLHGEGAHFCAGLDLSMLAEARAAEAMQHSRLWHSAFDRIALGRVPVIAALHGAVVGGGLELAAAAHLRIAEAGTYFALPEGSRGIFVGGGGAVRLPKLIGTARMLDMMLTGRSYGAEEAVAIGFAQYTAPAGGGLAHAMMLARRVAQNAPMTNFALIHALPRIADADPATGLLLEALMSAVAQDAPEAKRRLRDFLEKRAPKTTHDGGAT